MKHFKLIPLVVAIAALSACHQGGVGVDSGASQKAATATESGLRSDRSITAHTAASAAVQMPAAGLIVSALNAWGGEAMPPGTFLGIANLQPGGYGKGGPAEIGTILRAMNSAMPTPAHGLRPLHVAAAAMIAQTAQPCAGWPVGGFSTQEQAKMANWGRKVARQVAFSNLVLTQIAATPGLRDALADPQAAQKVIISAFLSINPEQMKAAWEQASQAATGELTLDMTSGGPAPVHFMIGNSDFQGGPTGWKWAQSGVTWFGDGAISGKETTLGLESAIDKSQSQASGTGTSNGASTEQGAGGSVGLQ